MRFRAARGLLRLVLGRLFRVEVDGLWLVPDRPYLLAANHLSWVDPFLVLAWLPAVPRVHFLGRRAAVYNRFWKRWLLAFVGGVVPVESGHVEELTAAVEQVLAGGGAVGIFPEGKTGGAEGGLQPLRRGIVHFAKRCQAPVLPVGIAGTLQLWRGKPIRLRLGAPIAGQDLDEIEQALRAVIAAGAEPPEPAGPRPWPWLTNLLR